MADGHNRNQGIGHASRRERSADVNMSRDVKSVELGGARLPRLLILTSTYPRWAGDPEPGFVHELAQRLAGSFDVMVLCPHSSSSARHEVLDGVQVYRYRYAPARWEVLVNQGGILANLRRQPWKWLLVPTFLLAQLTSLLKLRYEWRPLLIHAHWLLPQGVIAALAGGRPFVVTSHGADLFALKGWMFSWLRSKVVGRASAVTVVSDAMRVRLQEECPDVSVFTMPMGVDLRGRFVGDGKVTRSLNSILFVGRLVEKKGLLYLIEAMPEVLVAHPDARLDIVGFGPERDRAWGRVQQLGIEHSVCFVGAVPQAELPGYYQSAAVFVAPFVEAAGGDQEGLGLVVAEAIGCQCPVIVGDVPAVRDLVGNAYERIVPQRDAHAIASALIEILNDPATAVERAGDLLAQVKERFSWEEVTSRYMKLFSALLEKGCRNE